MKKKMTDLFDELSVFEIDAILFTDNVNTGKKRKTSSKWISIAAILVCCSILGLAGYAAYRYPNIFTKYFNKENAYLIEEMITEEIVSVENENYKMTAENMLMDNNLKRILISIEPLNKKSLDSLSKGNLSPEWSGSFADVYLADVCETNSTENGSYKKYYLYEVSSRTLDVFELQFEELSILFPLNNITTTYSTISITPQKLQLKDFVKAEKINIDRMGITIIGNCRKQELFKYTNTNSIDELTSKGGFWINEPEIIVELNNNEKICLLEKQRSSKSDYPMFKKNDSILSFYETAYIDNVLITAEYNFEKVFDTNDIVKIWINDVEYPVNFTN